MRRFEFTQGTSNKFWEIALAESTVSVRFGKVGTAGQKKSTECASDREAEKKYARLIAEKVKKGYVEVSGRRGATTANQATASGISVSTAEGTEASLEDFAAKNPDWFKKPERIAGLTRRCPGDRPELPDHPAFAPWKEQVLDLGRRSASMQRTAREKKPTAGLSFSGGTTAFLEDPVWPVCARCRELLQMCFQLQGALLSPWLETKKSLVGMYCFSCNPESSASPRGAMFLALVSPLHEVLREVERADEESHELKALSLAIPEWDFPQTSWLNFRSENRGGAGAFRNLLGSSISHGEVQVEFDDEYDGWVFPTGGYQTTLIPPRKSEGTPAWRSAVGGYPSWDQWDATPKCRKCKKEMQFLLDYNCEQFLDGAMHVFICDRGPCAKEPQLAAAVEF